MRFSYPFLSKTGEMLLENLREEATIYFHWPFCQSICTFCNFNKYVKTESKFGSKFENKMESSLCKETETILQLSGVKRIKSIYFGGGTPSLAPPKLISKLIKTVKELTEVDKNAEITLECNPSSVDMMKTLDMFFESGVNRVSVGLQSLNDKTLKILGRDHTAHDSLLLFKQASIIFGPRAVSVDVLFRKPGDTIVTWNDELSEILSLKPTHISMYELTPEKGTRLYKQLKSGALEFPKEDDSATMYLTAIDLMKKSGLIRYEACSFVDAKNGAKSAHNMSYWNGTQYLGIGPGAHSRFFPLHQTSRESRVQCMDPRLWHQLVEKNGHGTQVRKLQTQSEILSELIVTSLRTVEGVQMKRWAIFEKRYSLKDIFEAASSIQALVTDGKVRWHADGSLFATDEGLNVIDAILPTILHIFDGFTTKINQQ